MATAKAKTENQKRTARERRLKDCFNLTIDQWDTIFNYQGRVCAICKKPMNRPNVDHRHDSGKIFGILCPMCNRALGRFRDSIILIRAALEYLENPPAVAALGREIFGYPGRINTKKHRKWLKEKKQIDKLRLL